MSERRRSVTKKNDVKSVDEKETVQQAPIEKQSPEVKVKRRYGQEMEFDSDLFKLEVESMLKNISWSDKDPVLRNVEHCHFYRTIDSSGRRQARSSFIGGHVHEVEAFVNDEGELIAKCGPAIGTKHDDNHTHKVSYIRSDRIEKRKLNEEAQKTIDKLNTIPKQLTETPEEV